jgi:hypothetical protein
VTATAEDVREGLAAALQAIPGVQAMGYTLADGTPPFAHVMRGPIAYHQAMADGTSTWTMLVRVFVASVTDIGGQKLLDQFLAVEGERSVKAAIEADPTLGGKVADLIVTDATGQDEFLRDQGGTLLGSEWTVGVWL